MRPRFFRFISWKWSPHATCDERRLQISEHLPPGFEGNLSFRLGDEGGAWHDVISTSIGVLLFSERVVKAFREDGIVGMRFYEAPFSQVDNSILKRKPQPKYFWGRADGLIHVEPDLYKQFRRYVPVQVEHNHGKDIFHPVHSNRPPAGYACKMRVLETFRRHKITNLHVTPLDYYELVDPAKLAPPFRIDLSAKKWPPPAWYPDGFVPHPNNLDLTQEEPKTKTIECTTLAPDESEPALERLAIWSRPQPIDDREVDLTEPDDWRLLRMTQEDITLLEAELRIQVPSFLKHWLIENPFRGFPTQERCLVCHRDRLIHENIQLRREGYYGRNWPDHLLWIGDDWGGGAYFVDVIENPPAVYCYDWEEDDGDTVLPGFSEKHSPEGFVDYVAQLSK